MNENFFRTTFFELCSRYLSQDCTFAIEMNYPSGRSDWEMIGRPDTGFRNKKWIVEFKYFSLNREKEFTKISEPSQRCSGCGLDV
jgi:hypothetical protein